MNFCEEFGECEDFGGESADSWGGVLGGFGGFLGGRVFECF